MAKILRNYFSKFLLVSLFLCVFLAGRSAFANIIGNAGFEDDIGNGSGGNWDVTNGVSRVTAFAGFSAVPQGQFALRVPLGRLCRGWQLPRLQADEYLDGLQPLR